MNTCKNCNSSIPNWTKLDNGKCISLQKRSYCLSCSPYRGLAKRQNIRLNKYLVIDGVDHKWCAFNKHWMPLSSFGAYKDGLQGYCRDCHLSCALKRAKTLKVQAVASKGGKCQDCGGSFVDYLYEFHHLDPSKKDFKFNPSKSWSNLEKELDKCVMLCAHCHRHRHHDPTNPNYCPTS